MREIKFRGKTKDGRWVQGVPIKNGFGKLTFMCFATSELLSCPMEQIYKFCIEVIPETVTQYTGLKDRNGVEIYEGDILEMAEQSLLRFEVVYDAGHMAFMRNWIDKRVPATRCKGEMEHLSANTDFLEVIGNRFGNPDLLGGIS